MQAGKDVSCTLETRSLLHPFPQMTQISMSFQNAPLECVCAGSWFIQDKPGPIDTLKFPGAGGTAPPCPAALSQNCPASPEDAISPLPDIPSQLSSAQTPKALHTVPFPSHPL